MVSVKTEVVKNIYMNISEQEKKENIIIGIKNLKKLINKENNKNLKLHINSAFIFDEDIKREIEELEIETELKNTELKQEQTNNLIEEIIVSEVGTEVNEKIIENCCDSILYKKAIRSGHKFNADNIKIITENINMGGELVIDKGFIVLLKHNNGKITFKSGTLLISNISKYGDIEIEGVNIKDSIEDLISNTTREFSYIFINIIENEVILETI